MSFVLMNNLFQIFQLISRCLKIKGSGRRRKETWRKRGARRQRKGSTAKAEEHLNNIENWNFVLFTITTVWSVINVGMFSETLNWNGSSYCKEQTNTFSKLESLKKFKTDPFYNFDDHISYFNFQGDKDEKEKEEKKEEEKK